jgi:IMP dehydrogenase
MERKLTYDDISIIPSYSEVISRSLCDTSIDFTDTILSTPIIASPMDTICGYEMCVEMYKLGGIGILHRFMSINEQVEICQKLDIDKCRYGVAIGVNGDSYERVNRILSSCNPSFICIDVAHGHHFKVGEMIKYLKHGSDIHIMAGSIVTVKAALDLMDWGADSLRVGIGNGSMCETRIRAGVGIPQASAIKDIFDLDLGIQIIADGGCKTTGDVAKALALGADAVIIGSLFSGTKETPGNIIKMGMWPNEQLYKKYQGSASIESKLARGEESKNVEGNSKLTLYKGKVKRIYDDIRDGICSAMSYVGAFNMEEFSGKVEFVEITSAGQIEAQPHGVI